MLKVYMKRYYLYINGEKWRDRFSYMVIAEEKEAKDESILIGDWKDLEANEMALQGFNIWLKCNRKGIYFLTHGYEFGPIISSKKIPHLKCVLKVEFEPYRVSLNDILKYRDQEVAIRYLKQQGLSFCPLA